MKKIIYFTLALALVLGLSACGSGETQSSSQAEEEGEVFEISVETYFHGSHENEDGETVGVYVYALWYGERVEYQFNEYVGSLDNVVYSQEGTAQYAGDTAIEIERTEDDPGITEIVVTGNDMFYKIIREDGEEDYTLVVITEDEFEALKQ